MTNIKRQTYTVWFLFLFTLATANFIVPQVQRLLTSADECYSTDPEATYGYAPTGRPCPKPRLVDSLPFTNPQTTRTGMMPTEENIQNTNLLSNLLYLGTFPIYAFAIITILGTFLIWLLFWLNSHHVFKKKQPID